MKLEQIDLVQNQMFDYVSLIQVALEQKTMIKQTDILL